MCGKKRTRIVVRHFPCRGPTQAGPTHRRLSRARLSAHRYANLDLRPNAMGQLLGHGGRYKRHNLSSEQTYTQTHSQGHSTLVPTPCSLLSLLCLRQWDPLIIRLGLLPDEARPPHQWFRPNANIPGSTGHTRRLFKQDSQVSARLGRPWACSPQ